MSITTASVRLTALLASSVLAGCSTTTPQLDAVFGQAVREARAAQIINPRASENTDPVMGIDGKAGAAAQQRYQESFQAPPETFNIINIGGSITGN